MKGREIAAVLLFAGAAQAAIVRAATGEGDLSGHPFLPLIAASAILGLAAPLLVGAGAVLLARSWRRMWRAHRAALCVLLLLLLVPLPAQSRHFSDAAGPENPRGFYPAEPAWMPLGVALATGGRVGPLGAEFVFDETRLDGLWSFAPLAWVATFAALLLWRRGESPAPVAGRPS